jgi:hypothetical protein
MAMGVNTHGSVVENTGDDSGGTVAEYGRSGNSRDSPMTVLGFGEGQAEFSRRLRRGHDNRIRRTMDADVLRKFVAMLDNGGSEEDIVQFLLTVDAEKRAPLCARANEIKAQVDRGEEPNFEADF